MIGSTFSAPLMVAAIAGQRLRRQLISRAGFRTASDVVGWFGAVQAQEYEPAKWGLGLRMRDGLAADVERAFEEGRILRTHVMRPTWHFVTPADIRWLLDLTAPRVHRVMSSYNRSLELDARMLVRGMGIIERALGGGAYLTRAELGERLHRAGLQMAGPRLAHLAMHAELEGVICSGPRTGKQFTYALLAERAPADRRLSRDEALAELTRRYFRSHGPATIRDFVWWSGLTTADAKRGLEMNRARREDAGDLSYWTIGRAPTGAVRSHSVQLLPIYDEYLVAYRDREAVPRLVSVVTTGNRFVTFQHALVVAGQVVGTWRVARHARGASIEATPAREMSRPERHGLVEAVRRYQHFLSENVDLTMA